MEGDDGRIQNEMAGNQDQKEGRGSHQLTLDRGAQENFNGEVSAKRERSTEPNLQPARPERRHHIHRAFPDDK